MILVEVLIKALAKKNAVNIANETESDTPSSSDQEIEAKIIALRHELFKDMLLGTNSFFLRLRSEFGGKALSKLARLPINDEKKFVAKCKAFCASLSAEIEQVFNQMMNDFLTNGVGLAGNLRIQGMSGSD